MGRISRTGIDVLWLSQSKLFAELQSCRASGRYEKKFGELVKVSLLIIDDFGLRLMRSPQDEDFHDLISQRYEKASTIVTSNLDFNEFIYYGDITMLVANLFNTWKIIFL